MNRKIIAIAGMSALLLWAGSAVAEGEMAVVDDGALTEDLNVGSGTQTNANDWEDMGDTNAGGNQLTGGGTNSNGGDRTSDDVAILLGSEAEVANYALDVSVTENGLIVDGDEASADSTTSFDGASGFESSYGVTAVSVNAGAGASQSVSVNVTSSVGM